MKRLLAYVRRSKLARVRAALRGPDARWRGILTNAERAMLRREGYTVNIVGGKSDAWDCEVS